MVAVKTGLALENDELGAEKELDAAVGSGGGGGGAAADVPMETAPFKSHARCCAHAPWYSTMSLVFAGLPCSLYLKLKLSAFSTTSISPYSPCNTRRVWICLHPPLIPRDP